MSKWLALFCLLFGGVMTLNSCGDDSDNNDDGKEEAASTSDGHCDLGTVSDYKMCHTFSEWSEEGLAQAKTDCESADDLGAAGTYSASDACDTTDECGTCTWSAGSDTIYTYYYKVKDSTDSDACLNSESESHCTSAWSGTWTAKGQSAGSLTESPDNRP